MKLHFLSKGFFFSSIAFVMVFGNLTTINAQSGLSRHIYTGTISKSSVTITSSSGNESYGYCNISIPEISLSDMPLITIYAKHATDNDWRIVNDGDIKDGILVFNVQYTTSTPDVIWQYKIIVVK